MKVVILLLFMLATGIMFLTRNLRVEICGIMLEMPRLSRLFEPAVTPAPAPTYTGRTVWVNPLDEPARAAHGSYMRIIPITTLGPTPAPQPAAESH
jgi:hypothetical protein